MIDTRSFATKSIFKKKNNPSVSGAPGIALDIGYSSVKVFASDGYAAFPSYAQKMSEVQQSFQIGEPDKNDILYKDENGIVWAVGKKAVDMIDPYQATSNTAALYVRDRTYSEMFLVLARCGIAFGMMDNNYASFFLQTGLPPAYINRNSASLREALAGEHRFSIKKGNGKWREYHFTLPEDHVFIMPQPLGTLLSITTDANGGPIPAMQDVMKSAALVFDPGFGTLDTFSIKNMTIDSQQTFDNLGMRRVLAECSDEIRKQYGEDIPVEAMQSFLKAGTFTRFDRRTRQSRAISFADILEECSKKVCYEALRTLDDTYNGLSEYKYLVVTGGTGKAWESYIKDYYKGMNTLTVLTGDQNDSIPAVFSNVRGYYMFLFQYLRRLHAKGKV